MTDEIDTLHESHSVDYTHHTCEKTALRSFHEIVIERGSLLIGVEPIPTYKVW